MQHTESIRILRFQQHYRDGAGHAASTRVLLLGIKHNLNYSSIPHHEQTHVLHLLYEVAMDSLLSQCRIHPHQYFLLLTSTLERAKLLMSLEEENSFASVSQSQRDCIVTELQG